MDCLWFLPLNFYIFSSYYPKGNSEWKFGKSVALKKKKKRTFWEHKDNLHKESKCWTIFVLFHFNRHSNKMNFVWLVYPGSLIFYACKFLSVVWMTPSGSRITMWTSNEYCLCPSCWVFSSSFMCTSYWYLQYELTMPSIFYIVYKWEEKEPGIWGEFLNIWPLNNTGLNCVDPCKHGCFQ